MLGGGFVITLFGAAAISAAVLKYNVAVKVPATIRPAGDLRLVQAAVEGTIEQIVVTNNQWVQAGDPIAYLDDSRLNTTRSQLQGDVRQQQLQLNQINTQIQALDAQILAEANLMQRTVQAELAELDNQQRLYQEQQVNTEAEFQEASASLRLAEDELKRHQQLAETGAIAALLIKEKETAVEVAITRVNRARVALNPTDAAIAKAKQQVAQAQAQGEATLATLRQQRGQLLQNQAELQSQLDRSQKELQQAERDFDRRIIRAPIAGTLLQLNLRNSKQVVQPGDAVAYIAPHDAPLLIKAQVPAQDIDKVRKGQQVQMQVSACPYPDYGTLKGTVEAVAPDALPVANLGGVAAQTAATETTYEVTILPQTAYVGTGSHSCHLQAGMEGKADIISRRETILQFILRKARLISNL
jgi:HlyD family secretion protein